MMVKALLNELDQISTCVSVKPFTSHEMTHTLRNDVSIVYSGKAGDLIEKELL